MIDYYVIETSPGLYWGYVDEFDEGVMYECKDQEFCDAVKYSNLAHMKYYAELYKGKIKRVKTIIEGVK